MGYAHREIKRFYLEGQIADEGAIPRLKDRYIMLLQDQMEDQGFTTRLDINPDFTVNYTGTVFEFQLSLYGVEVGRQEALCLAGIDKDKPISKPTQKNKSVEASLPAEWKLREKSEQTF